MFHYKRVFYKVLRNEKKTISKHITIFRELFFLDFCHSSLETGLMRLMAQGGERAFKYIFRKIENYQLTFFFSARLTVSGGTLNITNAVIDDSGVYQCVAESRMGMVVTATALYVEKPQPW